MIYIERSFSECVDTAALSRICDLKPSHFVVLILSAQLPDPYHYLRGLERESFYVCHAGAITSAALLGFKLAHLSRIKSRAEEQQRLEAERAGLIKELEAALTPDVAEQVEQIMGRRSSVAASTSEFPALPIANNDVQVRGCEAT